MKPVIGITSGVREGAVVVPRTYVESVRKAGGLPFVIPVVGDRELASGFLEALDGLLLTGGPDLDPSHFGQDPEPGLGAVTPERDTDELALARQALKEKKPILAICRGIQLLNVAAGGTLIQHIPAAVKSPLKHRQEAPRWHASHRITLEPGSLVMRLTKPHEKDREDRELWVNSFHHQVVDDPAPGFAVTATAPDGVIEAIENSDYPFVIGVQWHPEGMWEHHPEQLGLFQGLVRTAGGES